MKAIRFDELDPIPEVAFLLVTAVDIERDAMLAHMRPLLDEPTVLKVGTSEGTHYLGTCGEYPVALVTCEAGSGGRDGSALTIAGAIDLWTPYAVILVGIAFGRDPDRQRVGDVLMSTQVVPYELQRVGEAETVQRGPRPEADRHLRDRVRHLEWTWIPPDESVARRPERGPILSGEKLADNKEFTKGLFHLYPDAIGGEMEGAGLYSAAARRGLPWIIIKAICDWGFDKDKRHHPLAARNACAVAHALLCERTLRAEDLGRTASPSETRATRALREETRRARFQGLSASIRAAQNSQIGRAREQELFLADHAEAIRAGGPDGTSLLAQAEALGAHREAMLEAMLNAYNDACAALIHDEIGEELFFATFGDEIAEICTEEVTRSRMQPRESSAFGAIWDAFDRLRAGAPPR